MLFDTAVIQERMATIAHIFREVQESLPVTVDWAHSPLDFQKYPELFRSIAYESASMQCALADIKQQHNLLHWLRFLDLHKAAHATQIYIGLGWALAQEHWPPEEFLVLCDGVDVAKVADGYGYYEGMFRRRKSILQQHQWSYANEVIIKHYDAGLGRSMWYAAQGNFDSAQQTIASFAINRQPDLWQGLGTAISYVGGCSADYLKHILHVAGPYGSNLVQGARSVVQSRKQSGLLSPDANLTLEIWSQG
ncbi:MAG: DUF1702 family protein [Bacteroidetes bacterium]|nr:DUF1702 family protein [Bacteroidota bacterium]